MQEKICELKVNSVSKCTQGGEAYIAILKEEGGERIMPVLMERSEAHSLLVKMKEEQKDRATPSCGADILKEIFGQCNMKMEEVRVAEVNSGVTYCHVIYKKDNQTQTVHSCRASDGLVLACTFHCPIRVSEQLLEQQYMRELEQGTYSIPANSVGLEVLKEALKNAVEEENYELASRLRDEIEKRK